MPTADEREGKTGNSQRKDEEKARRHLESEADDDFWFSYYSIIISFTFQVVFQSDFLLIFQLIFEYKFPISNILKHQSIQWDPKNFQKTFNGQKHFRVFFYMISMKDFGMKLRNWGNGRVRKLSSYEPKLKKGTLERLRLESERTREGYAKLRQIWLLKVKIV